MSSGDTRTDGELVLLAQDGDESAFTALCDRHAAGLRTFVRKRMSPALRRKHSADDILQDALVVVARRLGDFTDRGEGSFAAWLRRIVEVKTLEAIKKYGGTARRAAVAEVSRDARRETAAFVGNGPSPSEVAMAAELRERVRAAIEGLPPDDADVLRYLQEWHLTIVETAERMNRTPNAVKKLYARAVARLSRRLGMSDGRKP